MNQALKKAIIGKLAGATAVTNLLSASSAIYWGMAGENAVEPFIVCAYAGGGALNDVLRDAQDVTVTVKAVSNVSVTSAGAIADAVYNTLHNAELTYDDGWKHIKCNQTGAFEFVETEERVQYWQAGHIFRVRLGK